MKKATIRNGTLVLLALGLVVVFVYLVAPKNVLQASIAKDIRRDVARFTPTESIDLAMATKLVTHAPPVMLNPPVNTPPLVLYPPTEADLVRLSGN
jgi:hypothetical protein